MRFHLAVFFLINCFFYRLAVFFVHWYSRSFLILRRIFRGPFIVIAVALYAVWALVPVYLVLRAFFINLL